MKLHASPGAYQFTFLSHVPMDLRSARTTCPPTAGAARVLYQPAVEAYAAWPSRLAPDAPAVATALCAALGFDDPLYFLNEVPRKACGSRALS